MRKLVVIIALISFSFNSEAQKKATPLSYHGVEVYSLLTPTDPFTQVGQITVKLPQKFLTNTEWLNEVLKQSPVQKFDAIVTRNGQVVTFIQYKNLPTKKLGLLTNLKVDGVDVYYFSMPTTPYILIGKSELGAFPFATLYDNTEELLKLKFKLEYDAIVVGLTEVQYIVYKL